MNFFIENQFFHFDLPWKQPMLHSFVHVFSLAYFPMGEVWRKSNIENSLIHFQYGSVQYYFVYVRLEKRVFESRVTFIIYFANKIWFFQYFDNWNDTFSNCFSHLHHPMSLDCFWVSDQPLEWQIHWRHWGEHFHHLILILLFLGEMMPSNAYGSFSLLLKVS